MMIAYTNMYEHPIVKVPIHTFIPQLKEKVWGEWSPMDVIETIDSKRYKSDADRIHSANMTYPIIITGRHVVVDGYHRIAKAYLDKKEYIHAYVFDAELMNKCILNRDMDFVKVHQHMNIHQLIELWTKRFCD